MQYTNVTDIHYLFRSYLVHSFKFSLRKALKTKAEGSQIPCQNITGVASSSVVVKVLASLCSRLSWASREFSALLTLSVLLGWPVKLWFPYSTAFLVQSPPIFHTCSKSPHGRVCPSNSLVHGAVSIRAIRISQRSGRVTRGEAELSLLPQPSLALLVISFEQSQLLLQKTAPGQNTENN